MKNTRFHAWFIFTFVFTALSLAASAAFAEGSAISMEDAVGKGLLRSPEIASAAARLKSSDAALAADVPWRSGALTLKSDAKDQDSVKTGESAYGWSAGASLPLFDRLSLGASVSGDTAGAASGSVTASLKPFATTSIAARLAANSALFDYLLLVRTTTLALRSSVRALQVAEAEVAYRKAELSAKDFALERARLLVERGDAKRASLLDALSARTDALIALDAAEAAAEDARWTLATGTGMESAELSVMTEPLAPESAPVSEETWIRSSQKVVKASSDAESAADEARLAVPRPDLAIQGNLSSILAGSAAGTTGWTASATLTLPVDLVFRAQADAKADASRAKASAAEQALRDAKLEYSGKLKEADRVASRLQNARLSAESAELAAEESRLLAERGELSEADLSSAEALTLKAAWQVLGAEKSLAEIRDELDPRFAVETAMKSGK